MSLNNLRPDVAYGLSSALINTPTQPIVAARAPTVNDKAPIGQEWVVPSLNQVYFLTSIINNSATWQLVESSGGSGVFASVTSATFVNAGTTMTAGTGITATTGNIIASTGNIGATLGNIVATAGAVNAGTSMAAGTTITAGTGLTTTSGNVTASTGMLIAGATSAATVAAGEIGFSGDVNTTQGVSNLTILSPGGAHTNTGLIQINVAGTVAYIPYFENIS